MKIRSVSVDGLYNGFDYELKLNPDLTYIHSPNGYGKSTLMHMLYSALKGDSAYLEEIPFKRFDIEFVDGTVLIIENKDCKLTDRKSTRLNSSHTDSSRMPSSA